MITTTTPAEQRVLLKNISWQLFERLLVEMGEQRSTRLAYHKGKLELMTPLWEHEDNRRVIERLIDTLTEELNIDVRMGGSTTLKRPEMSAGKEPDSCYYIQNAARVKGKKEIDLTQAPSPDLALEIDITSSSLNQLSIYSDLGVPEVWRYNGSRLQIYQLQNGEYVECEFSPTFPLLAATKVEEFLEQCQKVGVTQAVRQFRQWIRNQLQNTESGQ